MSFQTLNMAPIPKMEFFDQAPTDLRLFVVKGSIDLEQFTILKDETFVWLDHSVRVAIIGESHFFSVQSPGTRLSEIYGCTKLKTNSASEVAAEEMPISLRDPLRCRFGDFDYTCATAYRAEDTGVKELKAFAAESTRNAEEKPASARKLHLRFPGEDEGQPAPETHVLAEFEDDLVVRTAHTYPPYRTIVFTKSRLSRRDA